MPAIGTITVNDGATTPIQHSFSPQTTDGRSAQLLNRTAAIPRGYEKLETDVRLAQSATGANKVSLKLTLPVVQAVNGVNTVVRQSQVEVVFYLSQDSTAQERKDARVLMANLLAHANVQTMIENVEPQY